MHHEQLRVLMEIPNFYLYYETGLSSKVDVLIFESIREISKVPYMA